MRLFISHSSKDNEALNKIIKILDQYNIENRWIDVEKLGDNTRIRKEINDGIARSTHFLLLWSKNADESDWVEQEISAVYSEHYNKTITKIIITLDETPLKPLEADCFRRKATNLEDSILDILRKYEESFQTQIKIFKKLVCKHYQNPPEKPEKPIIANFRKFDGYKQSISRKYEILSKNQIGNDISQYVLDLIHTLITSRKRRTAGHNYIVADADGNEILLPYQSFIPVVGDYGSGKSTLAHYILYKLCEIDDPCVIPIFVPLGELKKNNEKHEQLIEEIHEFIVKEYGFRINFEDFKTEIKSGKFIFILDALDEISLRLNDEIAQFNLSKTEELAYTLNVVLLTSRRTYFSEEMKKQLELVHSRELIKILDFTPYEVDQFIEKKFGRDSDRTIRIKEMIKNENLYSVVSKPLFLDAICESFDYLSQFSIINGAVTLRSLTEKWIIHDVLKNDELTESQRIQIQSDRQRISEILAFAENKRGTAIGIEDIIEEVTREFATDNVDVSERLEQYYKDARDSTFLTREDNNKFKFILEPVMEYFVARKIVNSLNKGDKIPIFNDTSEIRTEATYDLIKGIIDAEWAVKSHVVRKIITNHTNEDITKLLQQYENKSDKILKLIQNSKNDNPRPNVAKLVRILAITGNLVPELDLSELNLIGLKIPPIYLVNINLKKSNLTDATLTKVNLSGANLENTILKNANLVEIDISGAKLMRADLSRAKLNGSKLGNSDPTDANFEGANLEGANVTNVDFKGANLKNANFANANLSDCYFSNCRNLKDANFARANLTKARFSGLNLKDFYQFKRADLKEADFERANLTNADFSGAYMKKTNFQQATLDKTLFRGALIEDSKFKNAIANDVDFTAADLTHSSLTQINLKRAKFTNAILVQTDLTTSDLSNADFRDSNLNNTKFTGATLRNANFVRAHAKNADFSDSDIEGADFSNAVCSGANFNRTRGNPNPGPNQKS